MLAPAVEGFSPTSEFPEIAEAQTLLAALVQHHQVSEAVAQQQARAKLHVDYARAVQWGMGFAADETKAAFARAGALAVAAPGDPEYWAPMYGRFANFLMRGEFVAAHEAAAIYLRQAQVAGRLDHVVNARRLLGTVKLELGAFQDSREEFEALLANWDEDRDRALRAVTGADVLCVGCAYMAQALVCLGEVEAAVRMSEDAIRRAEALDDFGARAFALTNRLQIDAVRGRPDAMREPAEALRKLVSEKGTPLWELNARGYAIWARSPFQPDPAAAANEFGAIISAKLERKELMRIYHWYGLIAQLQSAAGAFEDALASIATGLEIAAQTGGHCKDSYLYRVRGDVFAKRDVAAAEAAYHEALRIAREQGARTFGLQAAHALGKLYRSMNRAADAHAVVTPALEGFSPTSEFPEIEEVQKLLAALVETDEVKNAAASRQRRLKLQTAYGQALLWARGHTVPETKAAFACASELARQVGNAPDRFSAYYGAWVTSCISGELAAARETAELFLREVETNPSLPQTCIAHRIFGTTCWYLGEFAGAHQHLQRALELFDRERHGDFMHRFGQDVASQGGIFDALALYALGQIDTAMHRAHQAGIVAHNTAHVPTLTQLHYWRFFLAVIRRDPDSVLMDIDSLARLVAEHDVRSFSGYLKFAQGWLNWVVGDATVGLTEMSEGISFSREVGIQMCLPIFEAELAQAEAQTGEIAAALARLDRGLTETDFTGERWCQSVLHRIRGEILLKRDPANTAPAEEAFFTAIRIAQQQKAKSFELRTAMCIVRLWRDQGRRARPANFSLRSTDGLPKGLIRVI